MARRSPRQVRWRRLGGSTRSRRPLRISSPTRYPPVPPSLVGAWVFVTVLISHAPLALLACGPPEPPFPPTRVGLEAVVALLANRQLAAGRGKHSRRQRCRPQERRRTASWQPDARKLSGCLRAAARSQLSQRWGVEMRCRVRGG
jgi:hypothetical protein